VKLPYFFFRAEAVKMVNLRHHAKFRDDQSNRCADMAIFFPLFKTVAAAICDF